MAWELGEGSWPGRTLFSADELLTLFAWNVALVAPALLCCDTKCITCKAFL